MKKSRIIRLAVLILGISLSGMDIARSQGAEELLLFSRHNFGLATARTAGMGGAFTSLGADGATMSINPAGIAMYGSGEIAISPGLRISGQKADYRGTLGNDPGEQMNTTKFNVGNFAAIYAGDNFAVGFGMNRLADFNGSSRATNYYGEDFSIGDMFGEQLYGASKESIGAPGGSYQAFSNYPPSMWGAIMGYQAALVDETGKNTSIYNMQNMLDPGALLYPELYRKTSGAINEYTFSGGYNYEDILYVGATLGVQDIYYSRNDSYSELVSGNTVGLRSMYYNQNLNMNGAGVNLKFGATVRPLPWLRIGVAYHSPTWINMNESYDADMTVWDTRYVKHGYSNTPILLNEYDMRTPSRFLAGVSATIGRAGIISVDYERAWYQDMKYSTDGYEDVNDGIKATYTPSNIIRIGAEFQPVRSLFLRAGYGYSSSVYKDSQFKEWGEYQQLSGGLGFRNQNVSIDLAYIYGQTKQMPYKPYSYEVSPGNVIETDGTIYTKDRNHNIILTLAFKLW